MTESVHTRPIYTVRWANFRALLRDRKLTITAAADRLGKLQGQVSHFGGKNPSKVIGDQIAEEIENAFDLPPGELDLNRSDAQAGYERVKNEIFSQGETPMASQIQNDLAPMLARAESWVRFHEKTATQAGKAPWGPNDGLQSVRRAERLIALTQLLKARGGHLEPEEAAQIIDAARQGEKANARTETPGGRGK